MTETSRCPHCGAPRLVPQSREAPGTGDVTAHAGLHALDSLYREVRRIRELAEEQVSPRERGGPGPALADAERRIAELTREVLELRATVARLRGSSAVPLARSA